MARDRQHNDFACADQRRAPEDLTLRRPLVLVGLMGAGKTSVGRTLAKRLGVPFADVDLEIEAASAMRMADIFERYGEAEFRALERRVMARVLAEYEGAVIASGGGAFMNEATRALIRQKAHSLWLRADLDVLVGRTKGRTHRPLLNGADARARLAELMEARYPVYAVADLVVDTFDEHPHRTAERVLNALWRLEGDVSERTQETGTLDE